MPPAISWEHGDFITTRKFGEASWVLEDNAMMSRAAQVMNGEPYKRYRVYEKSLYQGEERVGAI